MDCWKTMVTAMENENLENRVLVFMPTGRDATLVCARLEAAGIYASSCADAKDLEEKISQGAGAVLMAEEALQNGTLEYLVESFNGQPIWSDLPVVLFAGSNAQNSERLLEIVGTRLNATIVERPIRVTMLISAVRGALRARERQYQARDLLNRLEEADHQKDLFLATLSHELRTPLNSMLGWIQLLRNESEDLVNLNHGLEVIERNARTQSKMISDILFVSRVITGKVELKSETIDLLPIVHAAIDTVLPSIEEKKIKLKTLFDSGINQIRGDADRLQQVFLNLLSNAIKFTPGGGQIEVRATNKNSTVEIEIRDSGQGIKPEFLPFVFERFRQADNSYTREIGGLGLGLAIVRHLIELHGGTVTASSDGLNQGATFAVTLPVCARMEQPKKPKPIFETKANKDERLQKQKGEPIAKNIRVLLVEDNDDSREMLKILLEQLGIETVAARSAAEAFEIITLNPPDILISDVGLPDEDGYELMKKIRQLPREKGGQIPAIALTGYVSLQDRDRALSVGYQAHLAKPLDTDKLLDLVKDFTSQNNHTEKSNL